MRKLVVLVSVIEYHCVSFSAYDRMVGERVSHRRPIALRRAALRGGYHGC